MPTVVLIGDSIRMGYQEAVRAELDGVAEIAASDQNGGTSTNVLTRLDEWTVRLKPNVIHLNCGLHDIKRIDGQPPVTSLDDYSNNLNQIVETLRRETTATLIWATTTPVNQQWHHENKDFDRWESDVTEYNNAARAVAERHGVAINDLYDVIMTAGRDDLLRPDGVHFSPEGSKRLGKAVADAIRAHLD